MADPKAGGEQTGYDNHGNKVMEVFPWNSIMELWQWSQVECNKSDKGIESGQCVAKQKRHQYMNTQKTLISRYDCYTN